MCSTSRQALVRIGDAGAGQLTKWSIRSASPGSLQALSEGLAFAQKAGVDQAGANVISKGAAQSWQMENRGNTMVDGKFDFGFTVDWMRKGPRHLPRRPSNGARLPVTALVDQFYADVQQDGGRRLRRA